MAIEAQNISIREYAKYLGGISDKSVRNAIASGKIEKGVIYKNVFRNGVPVTVPEINVAIADEEWGHSFFDGKIKPGQNKVKVAEKLDAENFVEEKNTSPQGPQISEDDYEDFDEQELIAKLKITSKTSTKEATRIREVIGSLLDKMKLQEQKRILIKKDEVEKSLFDAGTEIKKKLLNIPARITSELRGAGTEVEAQRILTVEITEVLNEFAALVKID